MFDEEKVNKFSDKLNKAPVTVDAPREETRPAWQAEAFKSGYRKQRDGGPNFEGAGLYGFNSGTLELMCDSTSIFTEASPSSSSSNQARSARSDDWYGYRFGCVVDDSPGGKNYVVNKGQGEQRTSGKVVANAAHRRQDGSTGEGGIVPPRSEYSSVLSQQRPAYEPKWALPRLTTMGPAQFGYVWAKAPERFMLWTDLWAAVRDAGTSPTGSCGGGDEDIVRPATRGHHHLHHGLRLSQKQRTKQERTEAKCLAALQHFAAQGGRDPWNNSFNSRYEDATTIEVGIAEKPGETIVFESGAGVTGNRLKKHPWGELHRRDLQADIPSKPTLSHILTGGGYALVHLLVVKNCPRALEYLLNQTITTAVTPSSSPASSTEATEQGAAPDIYQAFSKRAIPGANTGTAAAAMFGGIASVAVAASKRQTSMKDEDDEEKEKDGLKTNGRTIKWALAKAAYQKRGEKVGDERTEEYKEKQSLGSGSSKEKDEQSRQWYQEAVDVNLASAQGETPLAIARALGHVACAAVLTAKGADLNPSPHPLSWLDVFRAIADQKDAVALETVQAFRRQGCRDPDGFGLDYHRMSRREMDEPAHFATSTLVHAAGESVRAPDKGSSNKGIGTAIANYEEDDNNDDDNNNQSKGEDSESISGAAQAGRQYKGLRGHQWWGYGDETLGWTLAHCAAGRDKPLCLAELGAAGADLTSEALPGGLKRNVVTPLSLATDKGFARCIAVLMRHRAHVIDQSTDSPRANDNEKASHDAHNHRAPAVAANPAFLSRGARVVEATSLPSNVNQWPSPLGGDSFAGLLEHRPWEQSSHRQSLLAANGNTSHDQDARNGSSSGNSVSSSSSSSSQPAVWGLSTETRQRPTYTEVWAAIASEPEPEAFLKLQLFLGLPAFGDQDEAALAGAAPSHVDPVAQQTLGRQQLGDFESPTCGFTLGHLCASRKQWRCFALVMACVRPTDRDIRDLNGRTAFELASDTHALSATCQPTANISANFDLGIESGDVHSQHERKTDDLEDQETSIRWHQVFDEIRDSCNEASALQMVHLFVQQGAVDAHFGYGLNHKTPAGASGAGHTLASLAVARSYHACVQVLRKAEKPSSRLQGHFTRSKELSSTQVSAVAATAPAQAPDSSRSRVFTANSKYNSGVACSTRSSALNAKIRVPAVPVPRDTASSFQTDKTNDVSLQTHQIPRGKAASVAALSSSFVLG